MFKMGLSHLRVGRYTKSIQISHRMPPTHRIEVRTPKNDSRN